MAKRKTAKQPVSTATDSGHDAPVLDTASFSGDPEFPFAHYTSIVGINSSLMVFVGLFLPRSSMPFLDIESNTSPIQATSRDRPQHPFLEPLTANPVATLLYICLGVTVLQAWWSAWVRHWWIDHSLKGDREDKKIQKQALDRRKLLVR